MRVILEITQAECKTLARLAGNEAVKWNEAAAEGRPSERAMCRVEAAKWHRVADQFSKQYVQSL